MALWKRIVVLTAILMGAALATPPPKSEPAGPQPPSELARSNSVRWPGAITRGNDQLLGVASDPRVRSILEQIGVPE
jgi:hypothetical protein